MRNLWQFFEISLKWSGYAIITINYAIITINYATILHHLSLLLLNMLQILHMIKFMTVTKGKKQYTWGLHYKTLKTRNLWQIYRFCSKPVSFLY
jgi:hypothetical protein